MDKEYAFLEAGGNIGRLLRESRLEISALSASDSSTQTFKAALGICLNSGFPIAIFWGKNFTFFYNDEYLPMIGNKHPHALGSPSKDIFSEIRDTLEPQLSSVFNNGNTIKLPDAPFLLNRNGYLEECYFDYTLSPIKNSAGKIEGVFNVVIETTNNVIGTRRSQLLHKLVKLENIVQPLKKCISNFGTILSEAKQEIPFFLIYLKGNDKTYSLVASGGIDQKIDHRKWPIDDLGSSGNTIHLNSISEYLSEPIITFYPEPCCEALMIALRNENSPISGFMIAGLSPRKKNDSDYFHFIQNVCRIMGSCFSSAFSFDELQALDQERDSILRVISHELKTPVTSIKAYAQLALRFMRKQKENNHISELLLKLIAQTDKLNQIITDMLDGTNVNSGKVKFTSTDFSLDELIEEIVTEILIPNKDKKIKLELNCEGFYSGDKARIAQVIYNLLSNALKYSPHGGDIIIKTSKNNNTINFSIKDQGIGISQNEQHKIFHRFYRSLDVENYPYPGIGLGLFIAKEIITLMGGKMWCESEKGKGSTFHFTLLKTL